jgi:dihydroorotate dehydrogenase electron transfer subunit
MMASVAAACQKARVACDVSLEAHMACGLGACLGCAVHGADGRYLHVCKNGPVMNAEEVAWNR